ncbi:hypothetical protein [Capnocytophaga sputigena]|jgi:hypothetical protein|uniref:hypothetical protein n=1 Tax=Capnocytophaga sputigena TaxID=1019 RepID=UPI0028EA05ED|nr:hypothetical protein [Capnocytophaga sputigena]
MSYIKTTLLSLGAVSDEQIKETIVANNLQNMANNMLLTDRRLNTIPKEDNTLILILGGVIFLGILFKTMTIIKK